MDLKEKMQRQGMADQGMSQEQIDAYFNRQSGGGTATTDSAGKPIPYSPGTATVSYGSVAGTPGFENVNPGLVEDPSNPESMLYSQAQQQDAWEKKAWEDYQKKLDALGMAGAGQLAQAGNAADAWNAAIIGNMVGQGTELGKEIGYGPYVGDASADPGSIAYQKGALAEMANRAQGGFTPVERAQMEMNRRMQERDLRSQREAQMRDMQMRGARSSGLEVAGMLGAQQSTAERQMLQNMQEQAQAQQRADRMLGAAGALAGDIRGQSFGESSFNKNLQSQYQNQNARFQQDERRRQWGIVGDTSGAAAGAVADMYQHQTQPTYFAGQTMTGNSPRQPTGANTVSALQNQVGTKQAREAADLLSQDEPFLKLGPFSI